MATTRDELNRADPNRLASIFRKLRIGEIINIVLSAASTASNTIGSAVSAVATADAATQTGSYVQADVQTIATLANALKASLNTTIALVNQLRTAALSVSRATETGVTVTSNVATLASAPVALYVVNATAGGTTGMKELLIGPITGNGAISPVTGQAVWDGATKVLFAGADAVTTATFMYATAADTTASALKSVVDTQ